MMVNVSSHSEVMGWSHDSHVITLPTPQQDGRGKLAVIGSAHIFSDAYLDKEENSRLQDVMFHWLTSDEITLNTIDANDPDVRNSGWN